MSILTLLAGSLGGGGAIAAIQHGVQSILDYKAKNQEYAHQLDMAKIEAERDLKMLEVNKEIAAINYEQQKEVRQFDLNIEEMTSQTELLKAALQSQTDLGKKSARWVNTLSASVRPVLTYFTAFEMKLIAIAEIYFIASGNESAAALLGDMPAITAITVLYVGMVGFWFGDRLGMKIRGIK
jgi:hypothetical protein